MKKKLLFDDNVSPYLAMPINFVVETLFQMCTKIVSLLPKYTENVNRIEHPSEKLTSGKN